MAETRRQQYYILCAGGEEWNPSIALLDVAEDGELQNLALAVYTSPEGEVQQEHLDKLAQGNGGQRGVISHITLDELAEVIDRYDPYLVFFDGDEVAATAFRARIQEELESLMRQRRA